MEDTDRADSVSIFVLFVLLPFSMKIVTAWELHAVGVGCQKWRHVHHLTAKNGEV